MKDDAHDKEYEGVIIPFPDPRAERQTLGPFCDKCRKHAMHFAAIVGLVGFLGGFMPLQRQWKNTGSLDVTKPSAVSGILMIVICAAFVGMCVNSFIQARKARKAGVTSSPSRPANR